MITTIETHSSIVFLTGEFAYKLKKSVNFGFLDFSTLALRKQFCELELQLNQRTAPQIYLAITPIWQTLSEQFTLTEQSHSPVEYLVKMKQFDPNLVLGVYLKQHTLSQQQIQQLAEHIAHFHQQSERVSPDLEWGDPDNLLQPMLENFPILFKTFKHPEIQYRLKQLANWTLYTQQHLKPLLQQRKQQGFIRACHGDLHLDNIALINEHPTLFDGIEFNEQFRWVDVINDLSFLLIDLNFKQQIQTAHQILNQYINITGDYKGLKLLPFYQTYRSMVRCKITLLRALQLPKQEKHTIQQLQQEALDFLTQAENFAYQTTQPKLILMQGVSGSGKSFYTQKLVEHFNFISISSDIERKRLYHIAPLVRVPQAEKDILYSSEMSQKTYQTLLKKAQASLSSGFNTVVDATFLRPNHRQPFIKLAQSNHIPIGFFALQTSPSQLETAITQREALQNNPSDATIEVMRQQLKYYSATSPNKLTWQQKAGVEFAFKAFEQWLNKLDNSHEGTL